MALNIAILIGITDYIDAHNQLPACKNDIAIMNDLLNDSGKFNEIVIIPSSDGKILKTNLAEHIAKYKDKEIDELFFYFTGHGDFKNEEFRYLLRDYSPSRPAQTSLSNEELDNLLRSLSPKVVVKVVDACYSGMPYIKDGTTFSDYMKAATETTFEKCYFLFSSQSDQASWATRLMSDFTKIFVQSVAYSVADSIRYKDIIDYISDSFIGDARQRPMFVVQGDFTETFGVFSEQARKSLQERLSSSLTNSGSKEPTGVKTLEEMVIAASREYVSREQAIKAVEDLKTSLESIKVSQRISSLFSIERVFHDSNNLKQLPDRRMLGKWLVKSEDEYFASPEHRTESYEIEVPSRNLPRFLSGSGSGRETVTRTRDVICGIQNSMEGLPFYSCKINLSPNYPNLTQYAGWITFLLSKKSIQFFYCFVEYKETTWGTYRIAHISEWIPTSSNLVNFDGGKEVCSSFASALDQYVSTNIANKLGVNLDNAKSDTLSKETSPNKNTARPTETDRKKA
ncbi:caspase family protein (plasmid) [Pseudomonas luteola]